MDPNSRYYGAAADYNKPGGSNKLQRIAILIGGAVLLLILIAVAFQVIGSISSGPKRELEQLAAREQSLMVFTIANQGFITEPALAKANSEASILTGSDTSSLLAYLGVQELSESTLALEADTSEAQLETARKSGRFNNEYRTLLQTKVAATLQLAQSVQAKSSNELNAILEQLIINLQAVESQL